MVLTWFDRWVIEHCAILLLFALAMWLLDRWERKR